jgi:hypothetical protein
MQGEQPFALVKDLCKLTNKKYSVIKNRKMKQLDTLDTLNVKLPSLIEVK